MSAKFWMMVALFGCGKVSFAPDASVDAPLPDALVCSATEMACSGTCVDTTSSNDNCGGCGIACEGSATSCMSGHCVDYSASCATIHAAHPELESGPYTLLSGSQVFCDMNAVKQYEQLAYGQYNAVPTGYELVSATDLQDPTIQKAFIYLFNKQNGAVLTANWTVGNCCFKASTTAGMVLYLGGSIVYPATTADASVCGGMTQPNPSHFYLQNSATYSTATLQDNFFTANPASEVAQCADNANPAFFWKRH